VKYSVECFIVYAYVLLRLLLQFALENASIKINVTEAGCEEVELIHLPHHKAYDPLL
jgi:hypothetical protein